MKKPELPSRFISTLRSMYSIARSTSAAESTAVLTPASTPARAIAGAFCSLCALSSASRSDRVGPHKDGGVYADQAWLTLDCGPMPRPPRPVRRGLGFFFAIDWPFPTTVDRKASTRLRRMRRAAALSCAISLRAEDVGVTGSLYQPMSRNAPGTSW